MTTSASPTSPKEMRYREFVDRGFVHLSQQLSAEDCAVLRGTIWENVHPHHLGQNIHSKGGTGLSLPLHALTGALRPGPEAHAPLLDFGRDPMFNGCDTALADALNQVFPTHDWIPAPEIGRLLMPAFPMGHPQWVVPSSAWHADEPTFVDRDSPMGVLAFVFLDDVAVHGGSTMLLSGSPRLLQQMAKETAVSGESTVLQCQEAIRRLRNNHPVFTDLFSDTGSPEERTQRFMETPFICQGISLRVEELTGRAGDIVLMDPRALHTISPNCSDRVRLILKLCAQGG